MFTATVKGVPMDSRQAAQSRRALRSTNIVKE